MEFCDAIDKAICAHDQWKQRLGLAIVDGSSQYSVPEVLVDNRCEFGKWFYTLPAVLQTVADGQTVQRLHAEFHVEAARVLAFAIDGNKKEAIHAMTPGERFSFLSSQLVLAMRRWEEHLGKE